jgi:uncharacterized protein (TIGR00251 family)
MSRPEPQKPPAPPTWPCLRFEEVSGKKGSTARAILDTSVSPNAKKTELQGWHDGALRIRLAAPPVDGAANDALRRWLASELGVPQARVTLLRGASSRRKQWAIEVDARQVHDWLGCQDVLRTA